MAIYTITEKQDINSVREGATVELQSLEYAKRYATKNQCFYGTTLTIEENGDLVAWKKGSGTWQHDK